MRFSSFIAIFLISILQVEAEEFWNHWGDGKAEIATYDISLNRYGEKRAGTAVAITVTENFSETLRVKADPGKHPDSDIFPVLKLNLVQDFQTGVYDYNLMTSVFLRLNAGHGHKPGSLTKVSFSSQEWCGHVYSQLLFQLDKIKLTSHSYFDGEADEHHELQAQKGLGEDSLFLWARGLASPKMEPGQTYPTKILDSLQYSRLRHKSLRWRDVTLSTIHSGEVKQTVLGKIETFTATAEIPGHRTWKFLVEKDFPHRLLHWETSDGYTGELKNVERMPYWRMNDNRSEAYLQDLGLR